MSAAPACPVGTVRIRSTAVTVLGVWQSVQAKNDCSVVWWVPWAVMEPLCLALRRRRNLLTRLVLRLVSANVDGVTLAVCLVQASRSWNALVQVVPARGSVLRRWLSPLAKNCRSNGVRLSTIVFLCPDVSCESSC